MPRESMPGFIRVHHEWTADERRSALGCRLGRFGPRTRIPPGLYALGNPGPDAPVLATASYRLTFDVLRRDLAGIDCWILALDTRGLDVASAAATGRFGTDGVVTSVLAARLADVVRHRTLILPMRAASTVDRQAVARATGFEAITGPERSSDAAAFAAGRPAANRPFNARDALALVPAEVLRSLKRLFPAFAFAALLYAGLGPGGVALDRAMTGAWPLLALGLGAVLCGSALAPLVSAALPAVPRWAAGLVTGAAGTAALLEGARLAAMDRFLHVACWLFFPACSAVMAELFRAALPVSAPAPARPARAVLAAAAALIAVLTAAALVLSKAERWG